MRRSSGRQLFWGGEDLLSVYCRHAAEQYLDYDSQTASFESEKFLNILTACAAVSSAVPAPDSIMQQPMHSAAMYRSMQISWYQQTGGAFRVLALDSDGGTAYQPVLQLGVCVGSAMQEAAEEALRNMLQEDFQLTIADAFPVNRAALRELMQKEIEAQKAEQQTAIREEGRVEIGEAGDLAFLFDEAAADDLMNVLEHADCRSCGNQEILKIILDEADAFSRAGKPRRRRRRSWTGVRRCLSRKQDDTAGRQRICRPVLSVDNRNQMCYVMITDVNNRRATR